MNAIGETAWKGGRVLWSLLLKIQRVIMLASIIVTTSAIMIEVIMRYIFHSSILGVQELAAYTALWLYFSGAAYGTYSRSHITAELTHLIFQNPRHMAVIKLVTNLISLGLLVYIIPWGWRYFEWGITRHEQSSSTFLGRTYDIVFFQSAIFYGIVLMAFYFLVEVIVLARLLLTNSDIPQDLMHEREEIETWI